MERGYVWLRNPLTTIENNASRFGVRFLLHRREKAVTAALAPGTNPGWQRGRKVDGARPTRHIDRSRAAHGGSEISVAHETGLGSWTRTTSRPPGTSSCSTSSRPCVRRGLRPRLASAGPRIELPDGWTIIAAGNRENDRGVVHRMLVVAFNRTIPEAERIEAIGRRIGEEDPHLLLAWAVEGASRLIRNKVFSLPASSRRAMNDWLYGADPVLAWLAEEVDPQPILGSATNPASPRAMPMNASADGRWPRASRTAHCHPSIPSCSASPPTPLASSTTAPGKDASSSAWLWRSATPWTSTGDAGVTYE